MRLWLLRTVARWCGLGYQVESCANTPLLKQTTTIAFTFARNRECYESAIAKCAEMICAEQERK